MLEVDIEKTLGRFTLTARFESTGGVTALFGRSGAGKSTLVNAIAGLVRPDRGAIRLDDRDLFDAGRAINVPVRRRGIGYVFQEGRLFPHYSVRGNLMYGRRRTPRRQRWGSFDQIVEMLGIGDLLQRRPASLSGGEKQRVAIGRALLQSPRLLLMDEPLASLDPARKEEILPYIERLRDAMKLPIVYVSHSVDEVTRLADTLVLLAEGRTVASGTVNEVFGRLDLRPHTGRFEASMVLTAQVIAHDENSGTTALDHPAGRMWTPTIDRPPGSMVRLRVRAREVALAVGDPGLLSIRNRLNAVGDRYRRRPRCRGRGAARCRRPDAGGAHHARRGTRARSRGWPAGRGADQVSGIRPAGRFRLKARPCGLRAAVEVPAAIDHGDAHRGGARADHAELLGGAAGQVDHPAADEGPAVVDAHDHRTAIGEIVDPDVGAEGKAAMGCRERIGIHLFSARRPGAHAVPGRLAALGGGRFTGLKPATATNAAMAAPNAKTRDLLTFTL